MIEEFDWKDEYVKEAPLEQWREEMLIEMNNELHEQTGDDRLGQGIDI